MKENDLNDKELYICYTYYHLFTSIIKNIRKKGINDLIIECRDNRVANNKEMIKKLKEKNIFRTIYILKYANEKKESKYGLIRYIKKYVRMLFFRTRKFIEKQEIDFKKYKDIFVFDDGAVCGKILNLLKIRYNLIEDGLDCYKDNNLTKHNKIKRFIKTKILKFTVLAQSEYIKTIEVNDKNGVYLDTDKLIELPRKELFNSLNGAEKKDICDIFCPELNIKKYNGYSMLLTQPFLDDGIFKTELEQINLYKKVISEHMKQEKVLIKTHPRDNVNYKKYFPDITIINEQFPIEILDFGEKVNFKKLVTVSSTAINSLENVEERVYLGWGWLQEYKQ